MLENILFQSRREVRQQQLDKSRMFAPMHIKAVETSVDELKKIGESIRRKCASADELIKLTNALVEVTS